MDFTSGAWSLDIPDIALSPHLSKKCCLYIRYITSLLYLACVLLDSCAPSPQLIFSHWDIFRWTLCFFVSCWFHSRHTSGFEEEESSLKTEDARQDSRKEKKERKQSRCRVKWLVLWSRMKAILYLRKIPQTMVKRYHQLLFLEVHFGDFFFKQAQFIYFRIREDNLISLWETRKTSTCWMDGTMVPQSL